MGMGGNRNEGLAKVGVNSRIVQVGIGHYINSVELLKILGIVPRIRPLVCERSTIIIVD